MNTHKQPHRKNLRLPDYDYSLDGAYFVTIVTQNRNCLFGSIIDNKMELNAAGLMIDCVCQEIQEFIPQIELSIYQIMPNHLHAIILINSTLNPDPKFKIQDEEESNRNKESNFHSGNAPILLSAIMQRFKSLTTKRYINGVTQFNWPRFDGRLWQRNYYEHVIRGEKDFKTIVDYIISNPQNWEKDEDFTG